MIKKKVLSYLLAFYYSGSDAVKSIEGYLFDQNPLIQNIKEEKLNQHVLFLMGLSWGYDKLDNRYILNKDIVYDVKFKFQNELDYLFVEGLYSYIKFEILILMISI